MLDLTNEKTVKAWLPAFADKHGWTLIPEVGCRHWCGSRLRIDYVVRTPYEGTALEVFGIEVKSKAFEDFKDVTDGFKQTIDYMESEVEDARLPGVRLFSSFLFNAELMGRGAGRSEMGLYGASRLAGKWNVGYAAMDSWRGLCLMAPNRLWSESEGPLKIAQSWGKHRRIGSSRPEETKIA